MRPSLPRLRWRILALANAQDRRRFLNRRRKYRAFARATVNAMSDIPGAEFIRTFRLDKSEVRALTVLLTPILGTQRRKDGISPNLKILTALSFYATGSYQTLVGQNGLLNVVQTTVSRAVREVTEALNDPHIFRNNVVWPLQIQDRNRIKAQFLKFGIPGVFCCIDGTHIAILRPAIHEERYFNRKGYHSLNVMIICDADLNIMCVDASSPGSAHDSSVWQSHPICNKMKELSNAGEQMFLLGDSGYPLRVNMMTPILNTVEGTPEHNYYKLHVTARNTVERCIGVLKARFRCLIAERALHYDPITAGKIINACCVLHNIANKRRLPIALLTPAEQDFVQSRQPIQIEIGAEDSSRQFNPDLQRGRQLQRALVEKLWRERNS
ncbi:putative nuclease HARBI1 [Helicoverpa armigera]|uniref:putative nuclease HARBI1 n=1 Tax=Helicoverpa armigera TaxID=29058 RepID=UPI0030838A6B